MPPEAFAWTSIDTSIVLVGALAAVCCGLLGTFLVLRRMSMMGDAISHAVLPGLVAAFLISGSRDSLTMFIGATVVGVLTALLTQAIHRLGRVDEGASMGVVFTTLFAIGIVLLVQNAEGIDLDPDCVLYGSIEQTPLSTVAIGDLRIPRAAMNLGIFLVIDVVFVVVFFKELRITSFDPALATTLGINADVMHYLLMSLVAANTVAAFDAVGSILVVAMLIVPGATAAMLADRLRTVLLCSVVVAVLAAVLGHLGAITVPRLFGFEDTRTAGSMVVVAGAMFGLAVLFAPRHGVLSRAAHRLRLAVRIAAEDALGLLYRLDEHGLTASRATVSKRLREALGLGPLLVAAALRRLQRSGLARVTEQGLVMTEPGRRAATDLVRSHRLWEAYLVKYLAVAPDHVHGTAMRLEHVTDADLQKRLAARAGDPPLDPHGHAIPEPAADQ
ncbi:MAG: metal ABC transporter permease [Phycisphaerales bacterium]|nr:metal ABC transporter permease [Phycisphaerales bacterium]